MLKSLFHDHSLNFIFLSIPMMETFVRDIYNTSWFNETAACFILTFSSLLVINDIQMIIWFNGLGERRYQLAGPLVGCLRCVWQTSYFFLTIGMISTFVLFYIHGIVFEIVVQLCGIILSRLIFNYQVFHRVSWRNLGRSDVLIFPKISFILFLECSFHLSNFIIVIAMFPFWNLTSNVTRPLSILAFTGNLIAVLHVLVLDYFVWYRSVRNHVVETLNLPEVFA